MVQSPSWEANWFAASQEIPRISRNPKVHYRTQKRPPPVSILGQPNPVHIPTSPLLEIHPNIIHPSTPRSPQWSLSLRFPHQDPIHPLSSPTRATRPDHRVSLLDLLIHIMLRAKICTMQKLDPCRKLTLLKPEDAQRIGKPKLRWLESVEEDLKKMGLRNWRRKSQDRE